MLWTLDHLLFVTVIAFLCGMLIVVLIFVFLTRHYPHEGTRAAFGSGLVTLVASVIFTVVINNLYAMKRDRDSRLRNLRDQHYSQLKPVLKTESSKFTQIGADIERWGHITQLDRWDFVNDDLQSLVWPDVLSRDLGNHFADYDRSKRLLVEQVQADTKEFREATETVSQELTPFVHLDPYWRSVDSYAFVMKCIGIGNGVRVQIRPDGYSFETPGSNGSASGGGPNPPRPSPDQIEAAKAYASLRLNPELDRQCDSLKSRVTAIRDLTTELSKRAELLSESTVLPGDCEFIRNSDLSY
jgi:hypothetical protein